MPNSFPLPGGGTWTACQDDDGQESQVEGMVVDHEEHVLYLAQEQVGVWRLPLFRLGARPELVDKVRELRRALRQRVFDQEEEEFACTLQWGQDPGVGGKNLTADVEGLTIYYGRAGPARATSSPRARATAPSRCTSARGTTAWSGASWCRRRRAPTAPSTATARRWSTSPSARTFPFGLLVVHDGENTPAVLDGEGETRGNTNFKYVPWPDLAAALDLQIAPWAGFPR